MTLEASIAVDNLRIRSGPLAFDLLLFDEIIDD